MCVCGGGCSLLCLIQVDRVTSWVTACLMLHEFGGFSNGCLVDAVPDRKKKKNPIQTKRRFPVVCTDSVTGHKLTMETAPLPK